MSHPLSKLSVKQQEKLVRKGVSTDMIMSTKIHGWIQNIFKRYGYTLFASHISKYQLCKQLIALTYPSISNKPQLIQVSNLQMIVLTVCKQQGQKTQGLEILWETNSKRWKANFVVIYREKQPHISYRPLYISHTLKY